MEKFTLNLIQPYEILLTQMEMIMTNDDEKLNDQKHITHLMYTVTIRNKL